MAVSALRRSCGTSYNGRFRLLRVHRSSDNESLRTNTHPQKWTGSLNSLSRRLDQSVFHRPDLLTNGSTYDCFEARAADVLKQSVVDQGLIVAAARAIHRGLKMLDNVVIEPNRDSRLSRSWGHHRTSPGVPEIVLPFHRIFLSYHRLPPPLYSCMIVH